MAKWTTNFHRGQFGNSLNQTEDLIVTIRGDNDEVPNWATGLLFRRKSFFRKNLIQIEQTGRKSNPSKDTLKFEMKERDGSPMAKGKYRVVVKGGFLPVAFTRKFGDNFEIV